MYEAFLYAHLIRSDFHIRVFRCFVRVVNTGEAPDKPLPGFLVQAFDIPAFAYRHRSVDINFNKIGRTDNLPCQCPHLALRADERIDTENSRVQEQTSYLGNPAYILHAVFLREAEILVDSTADIIAVQDFWKKALFKQTTL